jgi:hypothetical protein
MSISLYSNTNVNTSQVHALDAAEATEAAEAVAKGAATNAQPANRDVPAATSQRSLLSSGPVDFEVLLMSAGWSFGVLS